MKKILILFLACFVLASCASTNGISKSSEGDFNVYQDSINDMTLYRHKYCKSENIPSWNYYESLQVVFTEEIFVLNAEYTSKGWLFIKEIVLLDENNNKFQIAVKRTSSNVINGGICTEHLSYYLTEEKLNEFESFCRKAQKINIFYIGDKGRDSFKLPNNVKEAFIASVEKYREIKK